MCFQMVKRTLNKSVGLIEVAKLKETRLLDNDGSYFCFYST